MKLFNEHDDWDKDNYHVYYETPDNRTVFEDFGPERVDTGLVTPRGHPITKPNPQAKDRIGFVIPSNSRVSSRST